MVSWRVTFFKAAAWLGLELPLDDLLPRVLPTFVTIAISDSGKSSDSLRMIFANDLSRSLVHLLFQVEQKVGCMQIAAKVGKLI
jgi:hypothetical protein